MKRARGGIAKLSSGLGSNHEAPGSEVTVTKQAARRLVADGENDGNFTVKFTVMLPSFPRPMFGGLPGDIRVWLPSRLPSFTVNARECDWLPSYRHVV